MLQYTSKIKKKTYSEIIMVNVVLTMQTISSSDPTGIVKEARAQCNQNFSTSALFAYW